MNLSIRNISLGELENYIHSEEYRNSSFVPISRLRAISHMNNPRSQPADWCLFLAYDGNKCIGYLGALPDTLYAGNRTEKVSWLSCMWVLPEYRRHGIALKLLKHAYETLHGKVLITNYIPQSKNAFDKTNQYVDLKNLKGIRGYLRACFEQILVRKNKRLAPISPLLKMIDFSINLVLNMRLSLKMKSIKTTCKYSEITSIDSSLAEFIRKKTQYSLFQRGAEEFSWFMEYPWVKKVDSISSEAKRYHFSQEGRDFRQWFFKVERNGVTEGFIILSRFNGELRTPYLFFNEEIAEDIAGFIARLAIQNRIRTYIGTHEKLNFHFVKMGIFFHKKGSEHGFIMGKVLQTLIEGEVVLFDGDGDGAFI
jgi:GNAT superfamily N-acetyltransferase